MENGLMLQAMGAAGANIKQTTTIEGSYQDEQAIDLEQLVEWFEDAEETTETARRFSERDRDYYDNKQLTDAELSELKRRGQPDIIINRIQTKVNYLLGYEASQRTDPRAYPRTPQDEDAAEACTDALRYVSEKCDLEQPFSAVWSNMLVEGYGGVELRVRPTYEGDAQIECIHWHWDRLFYDPHSREHDFKDARYFGGVIWMDDREAEAKWPHAKDMIDKSFEDSYSFTYEDRPHWKKWTSGARRRRVRVVQMWYRKPRPGTAEYDWAWCIFCKGGKLESGVSPYRDDDGRSICNLILQSAFVDRENNRYGFVRALIGPQDEINKRRSKALHLLNVRQTMAEKGAVDDVSAMKEQLAKPDGHVEVNPEFRFDILPTNDQLSGHFQLLQEAKAEIDLLGPNAAMQGKGERSASGRAILANQQGGQIEITSLLDRHNHFKQRVYRLIWQMVRQYWTAQKWIRVTDDDKNSKFVGLNRPVTMAEDLIDRAVNERGMKEEEIKAKLREEAQANPEWAMQLQQVTRIENVPAEMDVDIILEQVPDSANIQQEQFEILAGLAQAGVQFPPKVYIEASALRDKRKLLEILEEATTDEANQQLGQIQLQKLTAEIEQLKADIEKTRAETQLKEADAIKKLMEADEIDQRFGVIQEPQLVPAPGSAPEPQMAPEAPQMPMAPAPAPQPAMPEQYDFDPMLDPGPQGPMPGEVY